jgi:uncharacterized protein DUF2516
MAASRLVFTPINGFWLVLDIVILVLHLVALVDACIRPERAYVAAGKQTKLFWVVLLVVATLIPGIGLFGLAAVVASIVYLVDVRPALKAVTGGNSDGGWYR